MPAAAEVRISIIKTAAAKYSTRVPVSSRLSQLLVISSSKSGVKTTHPGREGSSRSINDYRPVRNQP